MCRIQLTVPSATCPKPSRRRRWLALVVSGLYVAFVTYVAARVPANAVPVPRPFDTPLLLMFFLLGAHYLAKSVLSGNWNPITYIAALRHGIMDRRTVDPERESQNRKYLTALLAGYGILISLSLGLALMSTLAVVQSEGALASKLATAAALLWKWPSILLAAVGVFAHDGGALLFNGLAAPYPWAALFYAFRLRGAAR